LSENWISTGVWVFTADVFTVNVAVVLSAGIVTDTGTLADLELLLMVTFKPAWGATEPMVTVALLIAPPVTEVGLRVKE